MVTLLSDPLFQLILALAFAALFGIAAAHKWAERVRFGETLRAYGIAPSVASIATTLLASMETLVCAGLLWPDTRQVSAGIAAGLLIGYGAVLARALHQGRNIADCGCSLGAPQPVQPVLVFRNLALASVAALLLVAPAWRPLGNVDALIAAAALVTIGLLYSVLNTLLTHQPRTNEIAADGGHAHG